MNVVRVEDTEILGAQMELVEGSITPDSAFDSSSDTTAYIIDYNADNRMATFRFQNPKLKIDAAEEDFAIGDREFRAGSFIITADAQEVDVAEVLSAAAKEYGFGVLGVDELPDIPTHPLGAPRVAIMHTWTSTQNEGWVRIAFDQNKIPYDYISVHEARDDDNLRAKYDVIVMGPSSANALSIVDGLPMTGEPIAWKASSIAPNIGRQDETDDMRGGLGLEGVMHLRDFVRDGGVFIAIQNTCSLPVHFGLASGVSIRETDDLQVSGSVLAANRADKTSPIGYGFDDTLGVYFRSGPVLSTGGGGRRSRGGGTTSADDRILAGTARPTGRGGINDSDRAQGRAVDLGRANRGGRQERSRDGNRPSGRRTTGRRTRQPSRNSVRTIVSFNSDHRQLLISGMLVGGDELAGMPAVVDAPLGDGHFVLFAINPMWRAETHGTYPLVFNAIMHHDHLHAGTRDSEPTEPETENRDDEEESHEAGHFHGDH